MKLQVSKLGTYLDAIGDSVFMATLTITFWAIGYIDFTLFALLAAHRFSRLALGIYFYFYKGGFDSPFHMKVSGFGLLIYLFLIPILVQFYGVETEKDLTLFAFLLAWLMLLVSLRAVYKKSQAGKITVSKPE